MLFSVPAFGAEKQLSDYIPALPDFFEVKAVLSLKSEDMEMSANASVDVYKNDSISMKIFLPIGAMMGKLSVNKDSVKFFNAFDNSEKVFPSNEDGFRNAIGFELSWDKISSMFRRFTSNPTQSFALAKDSGNISIFKCEDARHNKEFVKVSENSINSLTIDGSGNESIKILSSNIESMGDFKYPKNVVVNFPINKTIVKAEITSAKTISKSKNK